MGNKLPLYQVLLIFIIIFYKVNLSMLLYFIFGALLNVAVLGQPLTDSEELDLLMMEMVAEEQGKCYYNGDFYDADATVTPETICESNCVCKPPFGVTCEVQDCPVYFDENCLRRKNEDGVCCPVCTWTKDDEKKMKLKLQ